MVTGLIMALTSIGPAAKEAHDKLNELANEEAYRRRAMIALIKIGSFSAPFAEIASQSVEPVFSYDFNPSNATKGFSVSIPQNAEPRNNSFYSSCVVSDSPLKIQFHPSLELKGSFTISFWWKATSLAFRHAKNIFSSEVLRMQLEADGQPSKVHYAVAFEMPSETFNVAAFGSFGKLVSLKLNEWYNLVVVRNEINHSVSIYLNGEEVFVGDDFIVWKDNIFKDPPEIVACFPKSHISSIEFGRESLFRDFYLPDKNAPFEFSKLTIFNRALNAEEIKQSVYFPFKEF